MFGSNTLFSWVQLFNSRKCAGKCLKCYYKTSVTLQCCSYKFMVQLNKRFQMLQCYKSFNEHLTQDFSVINSGNELWIVESANRSSRQSAWYRTRCEQMRCVPILVRRYQSMTRKGRLLQFVTMYNLFSPLRQNTPLSLLFSTLFFFHANDRVTV